MLTEQKNIIYSLNYNCRHVIFSGSLEICFVDATEYVGTRFGTNDE